MIEGRLRWWITNTIMLALAIDFLYLFSLIARYGEIICQEPDGVILSLEIASAVAIVVLAFLNYIKLARRS